MLVSGEENKGSSQPTDMSSDEALQTLYKEWNRYRSQNDIELFKVLIEHFTESFATYIDIDFSKLQEDRSLDTPPHLSDLPEGLLRLVCHQLQLLSESLPLQPASLSYAQNLVKCLIIFCRNPENVPLLSTREYNHVSFIVRISTALLSKLCSGSVDDLIPMIDFTDHALYFLEVLYDPYLQWRRRLRGWATDYARSTQAAHLHVEVVPFFYECFHQRGGVTTDMQSRLVNVFGAIMCGSQTNALRAICPATLDVLLKVLSGEYSNRQGIVNSNEARDQLLRRAVLRCLVHVVHVINDCNSDQKQIEVGSVIEGFFVILQKVCTEFSSEVSLTLMLDMLESIHQMLNCTNRGAIQVALQTQGCFQTLVKILQKTQLTGIDAQKLATSVLIVISSVMSGSALAKEKFTENIGYTKLVESLKSLGQPSRPILQTVLNLIVEDKFDPKVQYTIHNIQAILMIIQWMPDIQSHDLQIWLSDSLLSLCSSCVHNRMLCCSEGMCSAIIKVLHREKQISHKAIHNLIELLQSLGTLSIRDTELKELISLFRTNRSGSTSAGSRFRYTGELMHAMSVMARKDGRITPSQYFDLQERDSGIIIPGIKRWPGSGFSFHAWMCFDTTGFISTSNDTHRKVIYSFLTPDRTGFEAFFTSDNSLVICSLLKKDHQCITIEDAGLLDQNWHSLTVVYTTPRRFVFASSQLTVYIDGRQKFMEPVKCPPLNDAFTCCMIGYPVLPDAVSSTLEPIEPVVTSTRSRIFGILTKGRTATAQPTATPTSTAVTQAIDTAYGTGVSFKGQISSVCLFYESLTLDHVQKMSQAGPSLLNLFHTDDNALTAKLVFHYNAKSYENEMCIDLSPNVMDAQLIGQQSDTCDIKDVINSIGGVAVLFPLLEQVGQADDNGALDLLTPISPESPLPTTTMDTDWVLPPQVSAIDKTDNTTQEKDSRLEHNQVAAFLTLLRNMIQSSPSNQETLVKTKAIATLGALLQKASVWLIDVNVLTAIQLMVEAIAESHKTLLHHIYQYLLFDFRIWSSSKFPIRIGHIQYISTIIKEDTKYFRKKYGVQYLLDVIRLYYRQTCDTLLSEEDSHTIRGALLKLIKFYVDKDMTTEEGHYIMAFICSVREEKLVLEALDLVLVLMESPLKKEALHNLNHMFDSSVCEALHITLTMKQFSVVVKEKILKIFLLLLKNDKVGDKIKSKITIQDSGQLKGVINLLAGQQLSLVFMKRFMEILLRTETETNYSAALNLLSLIHTADIEIKIEAVGQLLATVLKDNKGTAAQLFTKQQGWQELLVRLLIVAPRKANHLRHRYSSSNSVSSEGGATGTLIDIDDAIDGDVETEDDDKWENDLDMLDLMDDGEYSDAGDGGVTGRRRVIRMSESSQTIDGDSDVPETPATDDDDIAFLDNPLFGAAGDSISGDPNLSTHTPTASQSHTPTARRRLHSDPDSKSLISTNTQDSQRSSSGIDESYAMHMPSSVSMPASLVQQCHIGNSADDIASALKSIGIEVADSGTYHAKTETLCQNVLVLIYVLMWKGLDSSAKAWKERGQVFAAVHYAQENYILLKSRMEIKRKLLEMMLVGSIEDVKVAGPGQNLATDNACMLVKVIYSFLVLDEEREASEKFSDRLIEDVSMLLDRMLVWNVASSKRNMEQLGLSILLAFAQQENLSLCSISTAKLHTLLQSRPVDKIQESCYVMGSMNATILNALNENSEHYNFLMPVMKALIDKCYDLLEMDSHLPKLPVTNNSPSFFDDFKLYCQTPEWESFVERQVQPSMEQYIANMLDKVMIEMKTYEGECHQEMMTSGHNRNKERRDANHKLQNGLVESYKKLYRGEVQRFHNIRTQLANQNSSAMRQWRSLRSFLVGDRGAWCEGSSQEAQHWKHSPQENYSRMKPKLVPNFQFDNHAEASRRRDNPESENESTNALLTELNEQLKDAKKTDDDIGDDRLGDEEWSVITEATGPIEETSEREKQTLSEECELITLVSKFEGRLEVTSTHIYFFDYTTKRDEGPGEDFKISLCQLREIHFRRYNLRRSALEFFLTDHSNYLINFKKQIRNKVYTHILRLRPPRLVYFRTRSPAELLKASGLTQKWVQREISNFEYLMQLNTIAGRTYNDLSQYPVFPWVLSDYYSPTLDLDNPGVYRDLSKPIGVQNIEKELEVREKFESFEDPTGTVEKFHYGTHYSNPAAVMHYLVRMEPYTTLHIDLQSGKFDVADRQFHSIPNTWQGLMDNPNDVKELIPEFYYLPDFLENSNGFDLGIMQGCSDKLSDVTLPPWATSAEDFIYKHRKALESDYVSAHLHEWIDLIFGYKQKGPAAVEACNVFYYCTYEGAVDLDAITDDMHRQAVEGMINNFGQTPCQLLKEPHPQRMTFNDVVSRASRGDKPLNILWFLKQLKAYCVEVCSTSDPLAFICVPKNQARSFIPHGMADSMVGITRSGILGIHNWLPYDKSISNFFTFEKDPSTSSIRSWTIEPLTKAYSSNANTWYTSRGRKQLAGPFAAGFEVTCRTFAVSHDAKLIFSAGHWDNSLRVYSIAKNKTIGHLVRHTDVVTCLSLDYSGSHLISGSRDTTCIVWDLTLSQANVGALSSSNNVSACLTPVQILYGHDREVTCVAISVELDMAVSGSKDGTLIIHTIRRGLYMQTLRPPCGPQSGLSRTGSLLTASLAASDGLGSSSGSSADNSGTTATHEPQSNVSIEQITLSSLGHIVVYCQTDLQDGSPPQDSLHVYTINGKLLVSEKLYCPLGDMVVVDGHVVLGNNKGVIIIKELHRLQTLSTLPLEKEITCLSVTNGNSHILAGLKDGKLIIVGIGKQPDIK